LGSLLLLFTHSRYCCYCWQLLWNPAAADIVFGGDDDDDVPKRTIVDKK
jgi:hypothetical protein